MNGLREAGRSAKTRLATAAVCSVLIAAGGVLTGTPASASSCANPTAGLMQTLGSASSLLGCVTGTDDPSGTATTTTGTSTDASTSAPAATDPVGTTENATGATDATSTVTETASGASTAPVSASSASSTRLAGLSLARSSSTVYPVKDGFEDTVRFGLWGRNLVGGSVPVVGVAELTHAGEVVKTWHIDGSHSIITWDGRVHDAVRTGLFTLAVTAWSPDGSTLRAVTMVRVRAKHLVKQSYVVRSDVGAGSVSAELPKRLLKAYATGDVFVRLRTAATVSGPAELVFRQAGVSRSVVLRNGVHTTKALPVPQGFDHVTITHAWKKGDAKLRSLKAIWTYSVLR